MCKNNKHTFPGMKHKLITYRSAIKLDCSAAYTLQHFTTTTAATLAHVCWKSYYTAKNIKIPGSMLFAARPTKNKYSSVKYRKQTVDFIYCITHVKTNTLVCTKLTGTYQQVRKGKDFKLPINFYEKSANLSWNGQLHFHAHFGGCLSPWS